MPYREASMTRILVAMVVALAASAGGAAADPGKNGPSGKDGARGGRSEGERSGGTIRNFVCGSGMTGTKEPNHAQTQRTAYSGRHPGPASGWGRSQDGL